MAVISAMLLSCLAGLSCFASEEEILLSKGPRFRDASVEKVWQDSSFGNFAADALRITLGTDLALIEQNCLTEGFPPSYITYQNLEDSTGPNMIVYLVQLSEEQLHVLLEEGVSGLILDTDAMRVDEEASDLSSLILVSGLKYKYDATAPSGERIMDVNSPETFDREGTITAAVCGEVFFSLPGMESTGMSIADCLASYLMSGKWESIDIYDNRIMVVGTVDSSIVSQFPKWLVIAAPLAAALIIIVASIKTGKRRDLHGGFLDRDDQLTK